MDFNLSEERSLLVGTADRFFAGAEGARKVIDGGQDDPAFWEEAAGLGLVEALLPPEAGGLGGDGVDLMVVFELAGRHLVTAPFLSTGVLGAMPLWLADPKANKDILAGVAAGRTRLALAAAEADGRYDLGHVETVAEAGKAGGHALTGHKAVVLGGGDADHLVVTARPGGGKTAVFVVDAKAPGLEMRGYPTIDGLQAADVWLKDTPGRLVAEDGGAVIEQTAAAGALSVAAEAVGLMEAVRLATLDYVKTRSQFGRAIGSFQVIQHRLVDLTMEVEQARSAVMLAASRLRAAPAERDLAVSAAKSLTGRTGKLVAEEAIQLHGGVAMCWETEVPHYAKRLVMTDHLLGDADYHLQRVMRLNG